MPREYTPEQTWKLFEKLPEDLQEAVFSKETADSIWDICEKNEINEVPKVAKIVGNVLIGLLPIDGLPEALEKELRLKPAVAKKISQEIHRFVFHPVRKSLYDLHGAEEPKTPSVKQESLSLEKKTTPPKESKKEDLYREEIEKK